MKKTAFLLLTILLISGTRAQSPLQTINPVIGDESYLITFGSIPSGNTDEQFRIQTHLSYVEKILREKSIEHLTTQQQQNRNRILDLLNEYWTKGIFPSNFDYPNERRPCFIDREGKICAVGYLVEKTAGLEVAEKINETHQYDFLLDMKEEVLTTWAEENGLTLGECAMIQPAYSTVPSRTDEAPVPKAYGVGSALLGGFNIGVNVVNLTNRNFSSNKSLVAIGILSGTTQILLGLTNFRKDQIEGIGFGGGTRTSYKAQNNLSYINIAAGTTTIITSALNLYLNRNVKDKRNAFNLYSQPGVFGEMNMGVSFARKL